MTHIDEATLNEYVDGTLDQQTQAAVAQHLAACAQCQAVLVTLQQLFTLLAQVEDVPVTADLAARVQAQIPPSRAFSPWSQLLVVGQSVAAVVMLVMLWPTMQPFWTLSEQMLAARWAALSRSLMLVWQAGVERVTIWLMPLQTPPAFVNLTVTQWLLVLSLSLIVWLVGNNLLLNPNQKEVT